MIANTLRAGGPIRKRDRGLGAVCSSGDNKNICCQDQNKHSTWHIILSKTRLLVGRVGNSGFKWSYKEIVSGHNRSVKLRVNENT